MARPTAVQIDQQALLHNLNRVKNLAPDRKVIAMVKANAYGCGIQSVVPCLAPHVYALGVACIEEGMAIRTLGIDTECVMVQGVFNPEEYRLAVDLQFHSVIHHPQQLQWLLNTPLKSKIKIWVKVNTGMHRLGFSAEEVYEIVNALNHCPWVENEIGLMTHFACADEPEHPANQQQLKIFQEIQLPINSLIRSMSNSAAIMALPETHAEVVRPGIMLYGVSPFADKTGEELGLLPVMHFKSAISAIHHYPSGVSIGYGATWQTTKPSIIAVVPVGYGDGYPRHISKNTPIWVNGFEAPIVGRVSMDMMTVDITECPGVKLADPVELWGNRIPVEKVASSAGTIAYELLSQFKPR